MGGKEEGRQGRKRGDREGKRVGREEGRTTKEEEKEEGVVVASFHIHVNSREVTHFYSSTWHSITVRLKLEK